MTINYKYSKDGISAFVDSAFHEAIEGGCPDITLSVGNHQIKIPMLPETYECMEEMLLNGFEILSEEVTK